MAQPIVNRYIMTQIVNLLDRIYHWGVRDAYRVNDEGAAIRFLATHRKTGVYGFLNSVDFEEIEWQLRIRLQAQQITRTGSLNRLFDKMGRFGANYLSVFVPLAQWWYCRGVEDYYNAPDAVNIDTFAEQKLVDWTHSGLKKMELTDAVGRVQLDCFELMRRDQEFIEANSLDRQALMKALPENRYMMFIRVVGLCNLRRSKNG